MSKTICLMCCYHSFMCSSVVSLTLTSQSDDRLLCLIPDNHSWSVKGSQLSVSVSEQVFFFFFKPTLFITPLLITEDRIEMLELNKGQNSIRY